MVTCALIGVQTDRGSDAQQCVYVGILIACTAFLGNTIFSAMNIIMRNNFIGNEKWTFGHILFHLLAAAVTVLIFVAVCKLLQSTD
jgi:chromate transport protein ChrA